MTSRGLIPLLLLGLGCRATTGRPAFDAFPEAESAELGFELSDPAATVARVTDTLAAYLAADSIPLQSVKPFDGFIESAWFDSAARAVRRRPSLGEDDVKIRVFVGPSKPGYARVEIETVFRPVADPSLSARELERPVSLGHPINRRIAGMLVRLTAKYGVPSDEPVQPAVGPGRPPPIAEPIVPDTIPKPAPAVPPPDTIPKPAPTVPTPDTIPKPAPIVPPPDTSAQPDTVVALPNAAAKPDTARSVPPVPVPETAKPDPVPTTPKPAQDPDQPGYWVQVAALPSDSNAAELQSSLESFGYSTAIKREGGFVKVRAGPFRTRARALAARAKARTELGGLPFLVVVR